MPTGTRPAASTYTVGQTRNVAHAVQHQTSRRSTARTERTLRSDGDTSDPSSTLTAKTAVSSPRAPPRILVPPDNDEAEEEPRGGEIEKSIEEAGDTHERLVPNDTTASWTRSRMLRPWCSRSSWKRTRMRRSEMVEKA